MTETRLMPQKKRKKKMMMMKMQNQNSINSSTLGQLLMENQEP